MPLAAVLTRPSVRALFYGQRFLVLAAATSIVSALSGDAWASSAHDSRNSGLSARIGPHNTFVQSWSVQMAATTPVYGSDGQQLYVAFGSQVQALSMQDGSIIWSCGLGSSTGFPTPALSGDGSLIFVVSTSDKMLRAISTTSGSVMWSTSISSTWPNCYSNSRCPLVVAPSGVVAVGHCGYSATNGANLFCVSIGGRNWNSPAIDSSNKFYTESWDNGGLGAYSIESGTTSWSINIGPLAGNVPVVSADGSAVYTANNICCSQPTSLSTLHLHAYSTSTGATLWETGGGFSGLTGLSADGSVLLGADNGNLYAFTSSGVQRWFMPTGSQAMFPPTCDSANVAYYTSDMLYVVNVTSGLLLWTTSAFHVGGFPSFVIAPGAALLVQSPNAVSLLRACRAGYFCTAGSPFFLETICASGTFSIGDALSCTPCPLNYNSPPGSTSAAACLPCPAGTYASGGLCVSCQAGSYSTTVGATSSATCLACPVGTSSVAGASTCSICASGYAGTPTNPGGGSAGCIPCSSGFFSSAGQTSCSPCPSGTTTASFASASASACSMCAAGYFESAAASCLACPAGKWSSRGASTCVPCPPGTYSQAGASSCTLCPAGTYGAAAGLTSAACSGACSACSEGSMFPPLASSLSCTAGGSARAAPPSLSLLLWPAAHPQNAAHVDVIVAPLEKCQQLTSAAACSAAASIAGADGVVRYVIGTAAALHLEAAEPLECAAIYPSPSASPSALATASASASRSSLQTPTSTASVSVSVSASTSGTQSASATGSASVTVSQSASTSAAPSFLPTPSPVAIHLAGGFTGLRALAVDTAGNVYGSVYCLSEPICFPGIFKLTKASNYAKSDFLGGNVNQPTGVAVAWGSGDLAVADYQNGRILRTTSSGTAIGAWSTCCGTALTVTFDAAGNIYYTEYFGGGIWKIDSTGHNKFVSISRPASVAVGPSGAIYFSSLDGNGFIDPSSRAVRFFSESTLSETHVFTSRFPATEAYLVGSAGGASGDTRKILSTTGNVANVSPANTAGLSGISSATSDADGNLFVNVGGTDIYMLPGLA